MANVVVSLNNLSLRWGVNAAGLWPAMKRRDPMIHRGLRRAWLAARWHEPEFLFGTLRNDAVCLQDVTHVSITNYPRFLPL